MKKIHQVQKILVTGLLGGLALWLILVLGVGAVTAPVAYAAPPPQQGHNTMLENGLKLAQLRLKGQQNRLDLAGEGADLAQEVITEQQAQGKDTAAIQTALDEFRDQIEVAQTEHHQAQQIFDAKAGFDANGKVTDPGQARETLQSIREAVQTAGETLRQGFLDFRQAMKEFRQANRPNKD